MPVKELSPSREQESHIFYRLTGLNLGISTCGLQTRDFESDLSAFAREHFPALGLTPYEVNPHHDLHEDEDLKSLSELTRHYRLTIEWSEWFPDNPFQLDSAAVAKTIAYIQKCQALGLNLYPVLSHFAAPLWLNKIGGWEAHATAYHFARFVKTVLENIGPLLPPDALIGLMNEPLTLAAMRIGDKSVNNGHRNPAQLYLAGRQLTNNLAFVIKRAEHAVKQHNRHHRAHLQPFITHQISPIYPLDPTSPFDRFGAWLANRWQNTDFPKQFTNRLTAVHYQYYRPAAVKLTRLTADNHVDETKNGQSGEYHVFCFTVTANGFGLEEFKAINGWAFDHTQGLLNALFMAHRINPNQPFILFEEGYPGVLMPEKFKNDQERAWWQRRDELARVLQIVLTGLTVYAAINLHHLPIEGIFHWSHIDPNEHGRTQDRFGLVEWDQQTGDRRPRASYYVWQKICQDQGLDLPGIYKLLETHSPLTATDICYLKLHVRLALKQLGLNLAS